MEEDEYDRKYDHQLRLKCLELALENRDDHVFFEEDADVIKAQAFYDFLTNSNS